MGENVNKIELPMTLSYLHISEANRIVRGVR